MVAYFNQKRGAGLPGPPFASLTVLRYYSEDQGLVNWPDV